MRFIALSVNDEYRLCERRGKKSFFLSHKLSSFDLFREDSMLLYSTILLSRMFLLAERIIFPGEGTRSTR